MAAPKNDNVKQKILDAAIALFQERHDVSLAEIAKVADGIGPAISADIVDVVAQAHAAGLQVHPYTLRIDDLPKWAKSTEELLHLLFDVAKVDGLFSDFPDVAVRHAHGGK